jgi:phage FluMu protein Com
VNRHYRDEEGEKVWFRIRRLRCKECGKLHRELPDILLPYKHYRCEIIEETLDEKEEAPGPDARTLQRWRDWFAWVRVLLGGILTAIRVEREGLFGLLDTPEPLLERRQRHGGGWLANSVLSSINAGYPAYTPSLWRNAEAVVIS